MTPTARVFLSPGQARAGITVNVSTAGPVVYTVEQMFGGLIKRECSGAIRTDLTPNAAAMIAGLPGCIVGTCFEFTIKNVSAGAHTLTIGANTGVTLSGTMTIAQSNLRRFRVEITETTPGAEAYTIDSISAGAPF